MSQSNKIYKEPKKPLGALNSFTLLNFYLTKTRIFHSHVRLSLHLKIKTLRVLYKSILKFLMNGHSNNHHHPPQ